MTTVSVICAPPNGRNTGMASVDLAFADVANGISGLDVTYWRLWAASEWIEPIGSSRVVADGGGASSMWTPA